MITAKKAIQDCIKRNHDLLSAPNFETGKVPIFEIRIRVINNGELYNLYVDYKTSRRWINRLIFSIGYWSDFIPEQVLELEKFTCYEMIKAGHKAHLPLEKTLLDSKTFQDGLKKAVMNDYDNRIKGPSLEDILSDKT